MVYYDADLQLPNDFYLPLEYVLTYWKHYDYNKHNFWSDLTIHATGRILHIYVSTYLYFNNIYFSKYITNWRAYNLGNLYTDYFLELLLIIISLSYIPQPLKYLLMPIGIEFLIFYLRRSDLDNYVTALFSYFHLKISASFILSFT